MRRIIFGAIAVLAVCAIPASASETQGWKSQDEHIHQNVLLPELSSVSAPVDVQVKLLLHNNLTSRHINYIRWSDGSNVKQVVPLNVTGDGSSEQPFSATLHLDPKLFDHDGWRELRVTTNYDKPSRTEFTTTRLPVFVTGSGKSVENYAWKGGSDVGRCGGGAWYSDLSSNYRIVFIACPDVQMAQQRDLFAGDKIRVKAQDGGLFCNLDPHFHAGDPGIVLVANGAANTWTTLTIPGGLVPGAHKLHCRSQTGVEAGAFVLDFRAGVPV
jgi:hypothetical protein